MNETLEKQAINDILKWAEGQPVWIRQALDLINTKGDLEEADHDYLYSTCINNNNLDTPIDRDKFQSPGQHNESVKLLKIKNVANVNALAADQVLCFSQDGMTIVYGDNGAGKSGYVRILKKACRARFIEEVLPTLRAMERRSRGRVVCGRLRFANQPAGMCSKSLCSRKAICGSCVCSTHTVVLRRTS